MPRDLSEKIQAKADAIGAESIVANLVAPATKDLSAKIQQKADELVNKALVNSSVNTEVLVNDRDIIAGVASTQADIRTQQMIRATDSRQVVEATIDKLKSLGLPKARSVSEQKPRVGRETSLSVFRSRLTT